MCKFWCNRKSKQKQHVFKSHGHVSSRNCFFLLHQQPWCERCWCHFHFECFVFAEIMIQQKSKCRENSENAPPSASCGSHRLYLSKALSCQQTPDWKSWFTLTGADFQNHSAAPGASVWKKVKRQPGDAALTANIFGCLSEYPDSAPTQKPSPPSTPFLNLSPMSFHSHFTISLWHLLPASYNQYT